MNYNDQILENKAFKFVKQLFYNIAISVVIVLAVCLLFVYAFHYMPYKVLTASMYPSIKVGDMVVVHKADEYKVGDVLKFDQSGNDGLPTVHRIIAIKEGIYVCHGDNVAYQYKGTNENWGWKDEAKVAEGKTLAELKREGSALYQYVKPDQIEGKVVTVAAHYGDYVDFISAHKMLFITIILGLWCFTYVVQTELEIKRARRLAD